jgi:hypothetical protein
LQELRRIAHLSGDLARYRRRGTDGHWQSQWHQILDRLVAASSLAPLEYG